MPFAESLFSFICIVHYFSVWLMFASYFSLCVISKILISVS